MGPPENGRVPILSLTSFNGRTLEEKWKDAKDFAKIVKDFPAIKHPGIEPDLGSLVLHLRDEKFFKNPTYVDLRQGVQPVGKAWLEKYMCNGDGEKHLDVVSFEKLQAYAEERSKMQSDPVPRLRRQGPAVDDQE
ncbi:uncharacterized protein K452DRAFT_286916 [Aplosporella prunicola CBS 121167]|uniref:Uncharacterized protein n=1 Tax=Aplosporella prunicola CBS 121167 TaxID=1176127 RepID=A0A6A6BGG4_9PEZI|nr:uncharacterized protein K452DRAFT_286916 [Aplosporella prunicola CBS 121167]KAF2142503.1 hypothetical protein K452DRAFT_286916 [Aplosporella prunicola CBS 121167]